MRVNGLLRAAVVMSFVIPCGGKVLMCQAEETDTPIVTISNENMVASMSENGRWHWETLNASASIQDFDDFFFVKCWRGYLQPRLKKGQRLTEGDAVLLEKVITVHNAFVRELTLAVITDMGVTTNGTEIIVSDPDEKEAIENFQTKDEGMRRILRAWAEEFKVIPTDAVRYIIGNIDKAVNDAERGGKPFSERHPVADVFIGCPGSLIIKIIEKRESKRVDALEERVMKLKTKPLLLKNKWLNVREVASEYLDRGRALRQSLKSVKRGQQDTRTAELIRDILARNAEESLGNEHELECMIYDVPMAIFSHRVIGQMRNCKGYFDNDERKMKLVMAEYCQLIVGTEMLKGVRTRYAASGYENAVKYLKNELYDGEFRDFVKESKLYSIIQKTEEDGRQNNEISNL